MVCAQPRAEDCLRDTHLPIASKTRAQVGAAFAMGKGPEKVARQRQSCLVPPDRTSDCVTGKMLPRSISPMAEPKRVLHDPSLLSHKAQPSPLLGSTRLHTHLPHRSHSLVSTRWNHLKLSPRSLVSPKESSASLGSTPASSRSKVIPDQIAEEQETLCPTLCNTPSSSLSLSPLACLLARSLTRLLSLLTHNL